MEFLEVALTYLRLLATADLFAGQMFCSLFQYTPLNHRYIPIANNVEFCWLEIHIFFVYLHDVKRVVVMCYQFE